MKAAISKNIAIERVCVSASDCVVELMHECDFECRPCVSKFSLSTPLKPTDTLGQRDFISLFTLLCLGPAILA